MLQLEYNAGSYEKPDWKQVARSDTAHGHYHIDFHFKSVRKVQRRESLPQSLHPDEEYESAKDSFVENEYEISRD